MIYILAGTRQQAVWFARTNGLDPRRTEFLTGGDILWKLQGRRDIVVLKYGTWYELPNIDEIEDYLTAIRATVLNVNRIRL